MNKHEVLIFYELRKDKISRSAQMHLEQIILSEKQTLDISCELKSDVEIPLSTALKTASVKNSFHDISQMQFDPNDMVKLMKNTSKKDVEKLKQIIDNIYIYCSNPVQFILEVIEIFGHSKNSVLK